MKLWTSALMEAILNNQQGETFFKAGGDMHHPDKEVSLLMSFMNVGSFCIFFFIYVNVLN